MLAAMPGRFHADEGSFDDKISLKLGQCAHEVEEDISGFALLFGGGGAVVGSSWRVLRQPTIRWCA